MGERCDFCTRTTSITHTLYKIIPRLYKCVANLNRLWEARKIRKGSVRKVRSDKKREVRPVIKLELKDAIYRLSYITYTPVKDVCAELCSYVVYDKRIIEHLSQYFKRDIRLSNTLYFGNSSNKEISKRDKGINQRLSVRFTQHVYDSIAVLSYAMDCTPSRTVAILLNIAMKNAEYVNRYMKEYLEGNLSEQQMRELRGVLKYVNHTSDVQQSWMAILGTILDEVSAPMTRVKDAVSEFLAGIKDKDK